MNLTIGQYNQHISSTIHSISVELFQGGSKIVSATKLQLNATLLFSVKNKWPEYKHRSFYIKIVSDTSFVFHICSIEITSYLGQYNFQYCSLIYNNAI